MLPDDRSFLRPGLWAGAALAIGAAVGLTPASSTSLLALASAPFIAALAATLSLRNPLARHASLVACFASAGLLCGLAAPRPSTNDRLDLACNDGRPIRFVGRLVEPVAHRLDRPRWRSEALQPRLSVVVRVDRLRVGDQWVDAGGALARLGGEDVPVSVAVGDELEAVARFAKPSAPMNEGEDDARPRLSRRAIAYVGTLLRGAAITTRAAGSFARRAERFRADFSGFLRAQLGDGDRASLVAALAVGDRGGLSPDENAAFNASGLAHVLSISGLHLAVAVLALWWVLRRLFGLSSWLSRRIAPRALASLVTLPASAFYVALVGAPAPALRAGLGTGLLLAGRALGRPTDAINTLGWTLAIVAALDPASLYEPSTQLSFLGVLGLALITPRLRELVPLGPAPAAPSTWRDRMAQAREAVLLAILGSLAATLATAPVTAACFERASLVAALANVVAWPASTLIVPAGALSAAVYPISPALAVPLAHVAGACASFLSWTARAFAAWPAASVNVPPPSPMQLAGYVAIVLALTGARRWRPRVAAPLGLAGALLMGFGGTSRPSPDGKLELTFLAVGQGDATFVRFPNGAAMLVDAGGEASMRTDPGERVVAPFLRARGVSKLDVMVASHPHPDHIGGLPAVLARFPTGELWHDGEGADEGPQAELIAAARENGARVVDFRQGLPEQCPNLPPLDEAAPAVAELAVGDPRCRPAPPRRTLGGVDVDVLHPLNGPDHSHYPELGENDNSLVLRLTHGNVRVLLPGDLEREGEALLLASGYDLRADLLKAPHHGSRTSSTDAFIAAVRPREVVFCVGLRNSFGFPKAEVVDRYEKAGCRRFRTDEGPVTFVSDGRTIVPSR